MCSIPDITGDPPPVNRLLSAFTDDPIVSLPLAGNITLSIKGVRFLHSPENGFSIALNIGTIKAIPATKTPQTRKSSAQPAKGPARLTSVQQGILARLLTGPAWAKQFREMFGTHFYDKPRGIHELIDRGWVGRSSEGRYVITESGTEVIRTFQAGIAIESAT